MAPSLAALLAKGPLLLPLPRSRNELLPVYGDIEAIYLDGGTADTVRELRYRLAPESMFHDAMQALEAEFPDVSLGSYPQTETRELIIRASRPDRMRADALIEGIRERVTQYAPLK